MIKKLSFDWVAWFYDPLARLIFGNAIRQSQVALLPFIPPRADLLIVGGGTGWLLEDLARLNQPLHIVYLELSPRMLARARGRLACLPLHELQVDFREGTEDDLGPGDAFDVIFTPFVLDLYPEKALLQMMHRLRRHLKPGGRWLVADFFTDPTRTGWQKWWQSTLLQAMYTFFGWLCGLDNHALPHLDRLFQKLPLALEHTQFFYQGFIRSQVYGHTVPSDLP